MGGSLLSISELFYFGFMTLTKKHQNNKQVDKKKNVPSSEMLDAKLTENLARVDAALDNFRRRIVILESEVHKIKQIIEESL